MGLFNRKHQDGRHEEDTSRPARESDPREEVRNREESPRWEDSELPTESLKTGDEAPRFEDEEDLRAPEPIVAERTAQPEADPIAAELEELDAEVGAPEEPAPVP